MTRKRRRLGRPSKYQPATAKKILRGIAEGLSRSAAAASAGIAESTFFEWQREFPEFSQSIKKADAACQLKCLRSIACAARSPHHWQAAAWLLERRFPETYGRISREAVLQDGQVDKSVRIVVVYGDKDNRVPEPDARPALTEPAKEIPLGLEPTAKLWT